MIRDRVAVAGFVLAVVLMALTGWLSWSSMRAMDESIRRAAHTHLVMRKFTSLLSLLTDVETGQRGYIITGEKEYLEPYTQAVGKVEGELAQLRRLTAAKPRQQEQLARLEPLIRERLAIVRKSIDLRAHEGYEPAVGVILTGRGKELMDEIRARIGNAQDEEDRLLRERESAREKAVGRTLVVIEAGTVVSFCLILTVFVLLWREIGQREGVEQRLRTRTREVEQALEEMKTMSYFVAHDLRGPLRGVTNFAQLLQKNAAASLDEQGKHYLERIAAGSQRMGTIIEGLLLLGEIGRHAVLRKSVDLTAMAGGIAERLSNQDPARPRVFRIQEGMVASADESLLRIALEHLLENAWKFTRGSRDPVIEFFTDTADGKRSYVVRDNGVGFDAAYAGNLFVPFQRLHREDEFHGVGIGLAIVKTIVLNHRGTVSAQGTLGKGAAFRFTLGEEE